MLDARSDARKAGAKLIQSPHSSLMITDPRQATGAESGSAFGVYGNFDAVRQIFERAFRASGAPFCGRRADLQWRCARPRCKTARQRRRGRSIPPPTVDTTPSQTSREVTVALSAPTCRVTMTRNFSDRWPACDRTGNRFIQETTCIRSTPF